MSGVFHTNDLPTSDDDPATATGLPTFLSTDPFPSNPNDRPESSGTAVSSEFGDYDRAARDQLSGTIPSSTGPVGEPGLPPSRPTSMTVSDVSSAQRRALAPPSVGGRRSLAAFAVAARGSDAGSRPGSAISRTHVPSLTAQGFYKPMSGQQLQAQRGHGATSPTEWLREEDEAEEGGSGIGKRRVKRRGSDDSVERHRYSNASVHTLRDVTPAARDEDIPPMPTSRGTMFSGDGTTMGGDFAGRAAPSVVSHNSTVPLHQQTARERNLRLKSKQQRSNNSSTAPRSPRSLREHLGLGSRRTSKNQEQNRKLSPQHEKLRSYPSSPRDGNHEKSRAPFPLPATTPKTRGRNYEYFAGNMLFFLSGRLLNTKAKPLNVATFVLTTLPVALFFAFSAPWLWLHVSPAVPIIFAYIFYITISSFLHAALSDPGILPRNLHPHPPNPEEERDPLTPGPKTTEWVMVKTFPASPSTLESARSQEEGRGGTTAMEVPTKYCKSCSIWRPPRAHHCRVCDTCIETQDHHCVWLNNCVGRRNYKFFFSFVFFASILAFLLIAFSLTHVGLYATHNGISFAASLSGRTQERVAFAMFIYAIVALPYPGSLAGYHIFLMARGETTREYLNSHKFLPKDRHRPFSQRSWWRNWVAVLVRPRAPSYMAFSEKHREGDLRFGHTAPKRERKRELRQRYSVANDEGEKGLEMKTLGSGDGRGSAHGNGNGSPGRLPGPRSEGGVGVNSTPR